MEHRTPKKRKTKKKKKERKKKAVKFPAYYWIPFTRQLEILVMDLNATSFEKSKTLMFKKVHRVL